MQLPHFFSHATHQKEVFNFNEFHRATVLIVKTLEVTPCLLEKKVVHFHFINSIYLESEKKVGI
jgi:hypothetical protein